MGLFKDFKIFIQRGYTVDFAVAIIIAGAFSKAVTSFVNDVLFPPLGYIFDKTEIKDLVLNLAMDGKSASIRYGIFLSAVIDLVILAVVVFLVIKAMGRMRKIHKEEYPKKECPFCRLEIPREATRCGFCTSKL